MLNCPQIDTEDDNHILSKEMEIAVCRVHDSCLPSLTLSTAAFTPTIINHHDFNNNRNKDSFDIYVKLNKTQLHTHSITHF